MTGELRSKIEALINSRVGKFRLQGQIARLWVEFSWRSSRRAATDLLIGSTLIDIAAIGFDYLIDPALLFPSLPIRGVCIPSLLLFLLQIWKHPAAVRA